MDDFLTAADAAAELLAVTDPDAIVVRDPARVWVNDEVFVFTRDPDAFDDQLLVVDRKTGVARFVTAPPWAPAPFADLQLVEDLPES